MSTSLLLACKGCGTSFPSPVLSSCHKCRFITKIYVDGSNAAFVKSLKRMLGENEHYERYSREEMNRMDNYNSMKVIPVSFSFEHKQLLQHTKIILEKGVVAINPKFDKLITALRTAVEQDVSLDKEATSYPDIMDAFKI